MESAKEFRFILDLQEPESPVICFAGIKDKSDRFLNDGKYINSTETAFNDGRHGLFHILKGL